MILPKLSGLSRKDMRLRIPTKLKVNDIVRCFPNTNKEFRAKIEKKLKCSAIVVKENGDKTVVNFDYMVKDVQYG